MTNPQRTKSLFHDGSSGLITWKHVYWQCLCGLWPASSRTSLEQEKKREEAKNRRRGNQYVIARGLWSRYRRYRRELSINAFSRDDKRKLKSTNSAPTWLTSQLVCSYLAPTHPITISNFNSHRSLLIDPIISKNQAFSTSKKKYQPNQINVPPQPPQSLQPI